MSTQERNQKSWEDDLSPSEKEKVEEWKNMTPDELREARERERLEAKLRPHLLLEKARELREINSELKKFIS